MHYINAFAFKDIQLLIRVLVFFRAIVEWIPAKVLFGAPACSSAPQLLGAATASGRSTVFALAARDC